jgi:aminoglycoside phosphotransferase family enzyme
MRGHRNLAGPETGSISGQVRTPTAAEHGAGDVPLAAKVAFLQRPDSYPEDGAGVETVETHMSWVFLTETHAYKMKKPVRYEFLDFRSLEARRRNSEEEVRLNRRLAREVYVGVVPLTRGAGGRLRLGGFGEPVDWLVKMHRLPRARILDHAIAAGTLRAEAVRALAFDLARFYKAGPPVPIEPSVYRGRFGAGIRDHRGVLSDPGFGLDGALVGRVCEAQDAFLARRAGLFDARIAARRIVEAHGDLRPEHICLGPSPQIIDCLEFKRDFRIMDPADELSFLALECELLGAPWVGPLVFDAYGQATGDGPPPGLIHFYKSYRACLRAKLAVQHLRDAEIREPDKWPALGARYLALAGKYARGLR